MCEPINAGHPAADAAEKTAVDGWFRAVRTALPQVGANATLVIHPDRYVELLRLYDRTQGPRTSVQLPDVPRGTEVVMDRLLPFDVLELRGATTMRIRCPERHTGV